ncbi:MAG: hypothetical protein ACPG5B_00025 [Chitinophagales bacterium]
MGLNAIDIAFIVVMGYGLYKVTTRDFTSSVLGFMQIALAVVFALRFSHIFTRILQKFVVPQIVQSPLFVFIIITLSLWLTFFFLGKSLEVLSESLALKSLTKGLGVILWLFILSIGFSMLLTVSEELIAQDIKDSSIIYPYVLPLCDIMICKLDYVGPAFAEILDAFKNVLGDLRDRVVGACGY